LSALATGKEKSNKICNDDKIKIIPINNLAFLTKISSSTNKKPKKESQTINSIKKEYCPSIKYKAKQNKITYPKKEFRYFRKLQNSISNRERQRHNPIVILSNAGQNLEIRGLKNARRINRIITTALLFSNKDDSYPKDANCLSIANSPE